MARTKNRAGPESSCTVGHEHFHAGKYIRLSKEDLGRGHDDSNSVIHQRKLLNEYCLQHADEFASTREFSDDGCTGTDLSREGFQNLIGAVMNRQINCVIVKDLSRLSRNYSDAGSLIENLFVQMNVRFISLSEEIDSFKKPDSVSNLLVPITNVMNDNFCYQTSKKIRQVFDYKRRNGEFIGGFAVYGYIKDPKDKHAFIIDEEAAEVVRNIYTWFLEGMSKNAIVHKLNHHGILCPSAYKKSKGLHYHNPHAANKPLWSAKSVGDILKNRVYAGDMVQGRQRVKSYKIHTQEQVPESEWFIVENTHKPIVDRAVFDRIQELLKRDTRTAPKQKKLYLFSGFLRCADCGRAMTRSEVKNTVYYFCRTYKDQSKTACSKHSIKHDTLEKAALFAIRQQIYAAVCCSKVMEAVSAVPLPQSGSIGLNRLTEAKEKELAKLMRYKQSLYQDWKDGEITPDDYRYMSADYEKRIQSVKTVLTHLSAERTKLASEIETESPFLAALRKHQTIDRLTREIIIELVDHIKVYENNNILIKLRFGDALHRIQIEALEQAIPQGRNQGGVWGTILNP